MDTFSHKVVVLNDFPSGLASNIFTARSAALVPISLKSSSLLEMRNSDPVFCFPSFTAMQ